MDDRTGRPEQIMAPALRSIIKRIDLAIENGSLDPKDRDEVIKMFIPGPTTVVDNKAGGGMMNMDEIIRPLGYAHGGMHYEHGGLHTRHRSEGRPYNDVLGRIMTKDEMRTDYAAPPPDPKDPDDLDLIINNMTFRVLHDKNRPMKENITRENYFNILPEEEQQIAEQLRMQLGISSDSPQYEYIRNKIIEEADKINKIRQEEAQPVSTKLLRGGIKGVGSLFNKMFGSKGE